MRLFYQQLLVSHPVVHSCPVSAPRRLILALQAENEIGKNAFITIACVVYSGLLWFADVVPRRGLEPPRGYPH